MERIVHLRRNLAWTACGLYLPTNPYRVSRTADTVTCKRCLASKVPG